MTEIAVITVARSDFGILEPVLEDIEKHPDLSLKIIVSGMHLSPNFGMSVKEVEARFPVFKRIESLHYSDTPEGVGKTIASGLAGFTELFSCYRPDLLLILGDRYDILPAALAALPFKIPIAHLHGGELTQGNIDDTIRHMISKLAHIHLVSTEIYARRLCQLGEEPNRVHVVGAPGLDRINMTKLPKRDDLEKTFDFDFSSQYLLCTFHPETINYKYTEQHINQILSVLKRLDYPVLFTYPNADTSGKIIIDSIDQFAHGNPKAKVIINAGQLHYLSLIAHAEAMVGNSSSGIIEAASFRLPVVNIGARQEGRVIPENVITCGHRENEIQAALNKALSQEFKQSILDLKNPYGDGKSAARIVKILARIETGEQLIPKKFYNINVKNRFKAPWD